MGRVGDETSIVILLFSDYNGHNIKAMYIKYI